MMTIFWIVFLDLLGLVWYIGSGLPYLISSNHTELVVFGFVSIAIQVHFQYFLFKKLIKKIKEVKNETNKDV